MQKRIIRIATALAGCILSATGCIREGSLDTAREAIRFTAGSTLLRDDVPSTKFGTLVEGASFQSGSNFLLYGRRNTGALIFNAREISLSGSIWQYDSPEHWEWSSSGDYYDFLALYLGDLSDAKRTGIPTPSCDTGTPLSASVSYDPSQDQYDLMLAGKRRAYDDPEGRTSAVHLTFKHMLCAVRVDVKNGSAEKGFTFNSYHFENLISRGIASVSALYDQGCNATYAWSGTSRLATPIGGATSSYMINPGNTYGVGSYDLMIPQNHEGKLGQDGYPVLVIEYTPAGGSATSAVVLLKEIAPEDDPAHPILGWVEGNIYSYTIEINLDGGVQVHVTTTPWDPVAAETPGLLLPEFGS